MKKLLSTVLALTLTLASASALAANMTIDQQAVMDSAATTEATVVPKVEVVVPGNINLNVEWEQPKLVFEKKGTDTETPDDDFYALKFDGQKTSVDVAFTLTNTSEEGSGADAFNGKVKVSAAAAFKTENANKNITIVMEPLNNNQVEISNDPGSEPSAPANVDKTSFVLKYQNDDKVTVANSFTTEPAVEETQNALTAKVTFTVTPQKDAAQPAA